MKRKNRIIFPCLFLILGVSFLFASLFGGGYIEPKTVIFYLVHPAKTGIDRDIIWLIRIPRIILGAVVGGGLSCCGAVFQGLLRNPLAEPYTLGISGGAALGVALGFILNISAIYLPYFAFAGGALSVFLVYFIASKNQFSNATLILAGVILSFLFSSLVYLIFSLAKPENVHGILLWLMGSLSNCQNDLVKMVSIFIISGIGVTLIFCRELNIITLGDEKASYLGVDSTRIKKVLFIIASCMTGACVAASGIIGFVGLIVPHFMRKTVGVNHQHLIPASCFGGAIFLILCDTLARTIIRPLELPVGVITGVFGGLFFLSILIISNTRWEIF
ncbi:MAG: FecCD family ABC transporter permease [bacterium]